MGTLLRQALTLGRLREAFFAVRDNRGMPGVDGVDVDAFGENIESNLQALRLEVTGGRYQPLPVKRVWLPRPGKSSRPLGVPTVRDRVLQKSVAQVITPLLEEEFEECSYAYRRGRSVRMAVERIGLLQRQGFRWVVEADIENFFDCIPHARLLDELQAVVRDTELVALVAQWLVAPVQDGNRLVPVTLGVVQGSPISPLLANLYLDHLDEALLDKGFALVRYADDFIVLAKSRERAEAAVELSTEVLRDLELKLNPMKTRIVNFDSGFKFLGWNFVRSLAVPAARSVEMEDVPAIPFLRPAATAADDAAEPEMTDEPVSEVDEAVESRSFSLPEVGGFDPAIEEGATKSDLPLMPPDSIQRTLYLVDPAVSLATENRHLLVRKDDKVVLDLLAVSVDQVMIFGRNAISTPAMVCCMQHGIPVSFLSRMGKFYGRLEPPQDGTVSLLAAQFAVHADKTLDLALAREFVRGKLLNSALLLSRYSRHRKTDKDQRIHDSIELLRTLARRTHGAIDADSLRGLEGAGASAYFAAWRVWLTPEWKFGARQQQSGVDHINALLDFGYTLLYQAVGGLIQARGLNCCLGHLHAVSSGHMALASDVMEEFRAMVVDTVVLNMCLNHQLTPGDFSVKNGEYVLSTEAARFFVRAIETRLNTERQHPQGGEMLDMRRLVDSQVRSLIACYRKKDGVSYQACVFR
ncbi:MAG: CRISPR-associated endonuclease Cas1 [Gallionella sp.]|jgi:CRISPR-associated protein Cas1